jgi:16S rRNA processing protein RimM
MTSSTHRILLGEISGAHGIRGEVLVRSFAAEPEGIAAYGPLEDESAARTWSLKVVRVTPKGVVARVDGVLDRTAAEKLKGLKLYIERSKLPSAGEDEFYLADLIGLQVVDPSGAELGHVLAVPNFGAGDLLEIRRKNSIQTDLVPLTKSCVPTVDLERGLVVVVMPEFSEGSEHDEEPDDDPSSQPS